MVKKLNKSKKLKVELDFHTNENFADLFEESLASVSLKEGHVVKGEVIGFEKDLVHIDLGLKTEGVVSIKEFEITGDHENLAVGDIVDVYLEKIESRNGKALISREKAVRESSWAKIESALAEGKTVSGFICGKVKGGFTVDLQGVIAFLPGSQVDIRPIRDITPLMGIVQPFKILKIDRKQANIVISRRAILEESRMEERDEVLSSIKEGVVLDGIVKNITDYGAFVDLGSFDGLLHLTDISWSRINHPSEVLSLGQQIKVMVIKYNAETKRVSLGMKQLEQNPWGDIEARYPRGSRVRGKVSNIADYGAFVELESGIEGLVHVSEMSWVKSNSNPKKFLSLGQEVECVVLDVDASKHRISLGMKQCEENPWTSFASKHSVSDVTTGIVKNIVDFGVFVEFEGGIEGLVHVDDVAWDSPQDAMKTLQRGQTIEAVILSIDVEKERISLGLKQLENDPFEGASLAGIKKGERVSVKVIDVSDDAVTVEIAEGFTSVIRRNDLSSDKSEQKTDRFNVGDVIEAKVVSFDKKERTFGLSIKALEIEDQRQALADLKSQGSSSTTFGDLLGSAMNKR